MRMNDPDAFEAKTIPKRPERHNGRYFLDNSEVRFEDQAVMSANDRFGAKSVAPVN